MQSSETRNLVSGRQQVALRSLSIFARCDYQSPAALFDPGFYVQFVQKFNDMISQPFRDCNRFHVVSLM